MRAVVRQHSTTVSCEVSPWTVCCCYLLWWASFFVGGLYCGVYCVFVLLTPHDRLLFILHLMTHVREITIGSNSTCATVGFPDATTCGSMHAERTSCAG